MVVLVNGFYPVILTEKLDGTSNFYEMNFGFKPVFKSDWYVSLKMNESPVPYELALIGVLPTKRGKHTLREIPR